MARRLLLSPCLALLVTACSDSGGGGSPATVSHEPTELAGITDLHNQARAAVNPPATPPLPPMSWDPTVAGAAARWAAGCNFSHSGNGYGENIFASAGAPVTAQAVVSSWTSESTSYDYASDTCANVCGHYTQVVWRESTALGCAIQHCTTGSPFGSFPEWTLVVCDYDPPGNFPRRPY